MNTERWGAFTDQERAYVCAGLTFLLLDMFSDEDTTSRRAEIVETCSILISEINLLGGGRGIDEDLLSKTLQHLRGEEDSDQI